MAANKQGSTNSENFTDTYNPLIREAKMTNGDKEPQDVARKVYGLTGIQLIAFAGFLVGTTATATIFGLRIVWTLDDVVNAVNKSSKFQEEMVAFQRKQVCFNKVFLDFQQYQTRYHGQCE